MSKNSIKDHHDGISLYQLTFIILKPSWNGNVALNNLSHQFKINQNNIDNSTLMIKINEIYKIMNSSKGRNCSSFVPSVCKIINIL